MKLARPHSIKVDEKYLHELPSKAVSEQKPKADVQDEKK